MPAVRAKLRELRHESHSGVNESLDRRHRAGWSIGDYVISMLWVVSGSNGENAIFAAAASGVGAWWKAYQ